MQSLPAAAPLRLRELLTGPVRGGQVVGVHPSCVYVLLDRDTSDTSDTSDLVAVETADGLGLPCALRLGANHRSGPFTAVTVGAAATVGDGQVVAGRLTARAVRWWSPPVVRPAAMSLPRVSALAGLLRDERAPVDPTLPPDELLGGGPGLTPAGDDVLAGWLLAVHHHPALHAPLAAAVANPAGRTTALSTALLREAVAGRGVPAALAVADALGGHSDLESSVRRLLTVGHTSGAALALGLLRGATQACAASGAAA